MPQRERGKAKALRIDLTYHRQRSWLSLARWIAAGTALLLASLYAGWILWIDRPDSGSAWRGSNLSTGPLAKVHASFENDCVRCHGDDFGISLSSDAWQLDHEPRLRNQEQRCQECHKVDGHARAKLKDANMDRDCARCHRDHKGRAQLLTDVANKMCTECHGHLNEACRAGTSSTLAAAVADFSFASHATAPSTAISSDGQPVSTKTFRSLATDTGRVRFDHAQHLMPGQIDAGSRGGFQLSMLPPELRKLYAKPGQSESSLVQLQCADCHQPLKLRSSGQAIASEHEEGGYFAPIQFEQHCSACHQMTFAGQTVDNLPLPHVATRAEYTRLLRTAQTAGLLEGQIGSRGDRAIIAADAAQLPASSRPASLHQQRVEAGVEALFKRCEQCHDARDTEANAIERALAGTLEPLIPERWLKFGSFDHAAHSTIERCELCHSMPTAVGPANDHRKVFIAGPESCALCHRDITKPEPPEFRSVTERIQKLGPLPQPTWASDNCTECHRYHWTRPAGESEPPSNDSDAGANLPTQASVIAP